MKVTTKTMMVRVLAAALLAGTTLPAFAQDDYGRRGDRGEETEEQRQERRERRQERQEQRAAEQAAVQQAAQQNEARMEVQRQQEERRGYDQEAARAEMYERSRQQAEPQQERVRAVDRQGANERQQEAIEQRAQQMREDEARRVQQERQERYGYGDARDGNRDRDWNDGNRRDGGYDRDGRDGRGGDRYGDNRGGDGRGDRDGNRDRGDRDGRGNWDRDRRDGRYGDNRRWDNDSQRRWDGWQRDADRYRREAMQRHNANRYASLQQQRRMSQYRYQRDYWERQRRWYSGFNSRRYDRAFITAPIVYRYSRGGRWYDINRYAADTLQEAIRIGYAEGARAGDADRYDGWRGGYRDNFVYQDADFGYDGYYVSLPEYQYYFREGFRRGYEDAYGARYRYGRRNGSDFIIAAATLGLILNLQDY